MPVTGYISDILISEVSSGLGSYLPQWMNVWNPSASSLLRSFLRPFQESLFEVGFYISTEGDRRKFENWLGEPSRAWWVGSPYSAQDVSNVTVTVSGVSVTPVMALSEWNFLSSLGPVFIVDDGENAIYFRNLEYATISLQCTGGVLLPDLMEGADIYWVDPEGVSWIISAGSTNIQGDFLSIPVTGAITVTYPSLTMFGLAGSGTAAINGGPQIPLNYQDLWTNIDETGLLMNEYRLFGEDNVRYWRRLSTVFPFMGSPMNDGLEQAISRGLGLSGDYWWDGASTLQWSVSGVTNVWVAEYPATGFSNTEAMKREGSIYYTEKAEPINALIFQGSSLVNIPISAGMISYPGSGSVNMYSRYAYVNWQTSGNALGITALFPTPNSVPGLKRVMWTYGVNTHTVNDPIWKQNNLLNPDGSANSLFQTLGNQVMEQVPITLGYVSWGVVGWFGANDSLTVEDFRPIAMDG
jgi:hypothetical protein